MPESLEDAIDELTLRYRNDGMPLDEVIDALTMVLARLHDEEAAED